MRALIAIVLACLATLPALAQPGDPKRAFTEALGRFSVALAGRFADDGARITSSLAAMDEALARWDDAVRRSRTSAAALIEKSPGAAAARARVATAILLAERGLTSEAIGLLNEAITQSPRDVDAHTVLGLIHTQLVPNAAAAGNAFRQAVAGDPAAPLQRYLLAKYLADQGATDEAAAVGLALRTDTRPADAPDRAPFVRIHLIPEVPGIEPFFPPELYAQAFVMLAQADYQTALAMLHAAAKADRLTAAPAAAAPGLTQAGAALRNGDVASAVAALDGVRQAAPPWTEALRLKAVALVAGGQIAEGIAAFREAIRLTPKEERAYVDLAETLIQEARYQEADEVLSEGVAAVPSSSRLRYLRGQARQRAGRLPEALADYEFALGLHPFLPLLGMNSLHDSIATLYRQQQAFPEATKAFARRVDLVPNRPEAHRDLADLYSRQGLEDLAWTELAMAEALAPRDVATQAALAQLHLRGARHTDAAAAARRAIQIDPSHVQAHYVLGTALVRSGQEDQGLRELETFQRLETQAAQARQLEFELGGLRREAMVRSGEGDHARAVALLTQALEKDAKSAAAHLELGVALLKAGRYQDAVDRLQAAAGMGASGEVYRHLADAYDGLGQTEQSLRARGVYAGILRDRLRRAGSQ